MAASERWPLTSIERGLYRPGARITVYGRVHPISGAAEAFTRQARDRYGDGIEAIFLYGSVARGTERGADSDVDLLVVVSDAVDALSLEDGLRDLASDIELDRGVVLSLLVRSESDVDAQTDRPFFATVQRDATQLHG